MGIALAPSIGLEDTPHQPMGNRVTDNVVKRSGLVDLGVVASGAADQNCFSGNTFSTSAPANIEQVMPCDASGTGDFATGAVDIGQFLDTTGNPKGVGYKQSPVPKRQQNMPRASVAKARPAGAPAPVDLDGDPGAGRQLRPAGDGRRGRGGQRWLTRDRRAAKQSPKLMQEHDQQRHERLAEVVPVPAARAPASACPRAGR